MRHWEGGLSLRCHARPNNGRKLWEISVLWPPSLDFCLGGNDRRGAGYSREGSGLLCLLVGGSDGEGEEEGQTNKNQLDGLRIPHDRPPTNRRPER